jgi:hypothetical protein
MEGGEAKDAPFIEVEIALADIVAGIALFRELPLYFPDAADIWTEDAQVFRFVEKLIYHEIDPADEGPEAFLAGTMGGKLGGGPASECFRQSFFIAAQIRVQGPVFFGEFLDLKGVSEIGAENAGVSLDIQAGALKGKDGLVDGLVRIAGKNHAASGVVFYGF